MGGSAGAVPLFAASLGGGSAHAAASANITPTQIERLRMRRRISSSLRHELFLPNPRLDEPPQAKVTEELTLRASELL